MKFNSDRTAVACKHCDDWIQRGTDYAVVFYYPSDTKEKNPIGPYCKVCLPKTRVCGDCGRSNIGRCGCKGGKR